MDIDRHSPRLMPNNCQHLDPPYFSLPTTFKLQNTGFSVQRQGSVYFERVHACYMSVSTHPGSPRGTVHVLVPTHSLAPPHLFP
jgi:hypothetical protein